MNSALVSDPGADAAAFDRLGRAECIDRWKARFDQWPPKFVSVQFMRKALAYEAQVKAHGGHSSMVRRALERALKDTGKPRGKAGPAQLASPLTLRPGAHLIREWNGRSYQVEVLENGFQLDGKRYRSLSAIARKITGAHWSGPRFFGLDAS